MHFLEFGSPPTHPGWLVCIVNCLVGHHRQRLQASAVVSLLIFVLVCLLLIVVVIVIVDVIMAMIIPLTVATLCSVFVDHILVFIMHYSLLIIQHDVFPDHLSCKCKLNSVEF